MKLMKTLGAILFSAACLGGAHAQPVDTEGRPFATAMEKYRQMFLNRQFDAIDRDANESRNLISKLSDGQLRLSAIYAGVTDCGCGLEPASQKWEQLRRLFEEWRAKSPQSVTAELASIHLQISRAWAIRGSGYAYTVSKEAWAGFRKEMGVAYEALQKASPAARQDALWYFSMLEVGIAQHWPLERYNAMYEEGIKKHPNYFGLYFMAARYHDEHWYGSARETQEFIEHAVETSRPLLGDTLYARINWQIESNGMFTGPGAASWPKMKAGFERMIADYPDNWTMNNYAKFACKANDPETVIAVTARIQKPIAAAWDGQLSNYEFCYNESRKRRARPGN